MTAQSPLKEDKTVPFSDFDLVNEKVTLLPVKGTTPSIEGANAPQMTQSSLAASAGGFFDRRFFKYILSVLALTFAYYLLARIGLAFADLSPSVIPIWPPTGLSIAIVLLCGYAMIPGIFFGAFFSNLTFAGVVPSLVMSLGNVGEAVVAAFLVHRFSGGRFSFEHAQNLFRFILLAAIVAPTIAATVGVATLFASGSLMVSELASSWSVWWLANAVGAIVVTPLVVAWANRPDPYVRWKDMLELSAAVVLSSIVIASIFSPIYGSPFWQIAVIAVIPAVAWIALRFSLREVAAAIAIFTVIALYGMLEGFGPAAMPVSEAVSTLLQFQVYMSAIACTFYLLTIMVEQQRRSEAALKRLNHTKDEFLAALAHELRNPMAPMLSYMEMLRLPALSREEKLGAVDGLQHGMNRLTRLLDDLLDLARFSAGKVRLEMKEVDLALLLDEAVDNVRFSLDKANHTLMLDMPNTPLLLRADPDRIVQVFTNLLSNATKYTNAGGSIRVSAAKTLQGDRVCVRVRDNGLGIEPEELVSIFNMFAQSEKTYIRLRRKGGMGIGLRLVKIFTEMHGGSVEARSRGAGKGSEFSVYLPLAT